MTSRVVLWLCFAGSAALMLLLLLPLVQRRLRHFRGQPSRPLFAPVNLPGLLLLVFGFWMTQGLVGLPAVPSYSDAVLVRNRSQEGTSIAIGHWDPASGTVDLAGTSIAGRVEVLTWIAPGGRLEASYLGHRGTDRRPCVLGFAPRGWWPSASTISLEWATKSIITRGVFDVEVRGEAPAEVALKTVPPDDPHPVFIKAIVGPGTMWAPERRIWSAIRTRAVWRELWLATPALLSMAYLIFWAGLGLAAQVRRTFPRNAWKSTGMVVALLLGGFYAYRLTAGILVPVTTAFMVFGLRL